MKEKTCGIVRVKRFKGDLNSAPLWVLISSDEIYSIGCCSGVSLSDSFVARVFLSTKFHSSVGASTNNIRFGVFVKVVLIWVHKCFVFPFCVRNLNESVGGIRGWKKIIYVQLVKPFSSLTLVDTFQSERFSELKKIPVYEYPFIWDAGLLWVSISSSSRYTFKLFLSTTFVIYDHTHSSLACWRIVLSIQKFILLNNDVFDLYPQVYQYA